MTGFTGKLHLPSGSIPVEGAYQRITAPAWIDSAETRLEGCLVLPIRGQPTDNPRAWADELPEFIGVFGLDIDGLGACDANISNAEIDYAGRFEGGPHVVCSMTATERKLAIAFPARPPLQSHLV